MFVSVVRHATLSIHYINCEREDKHFYDMLWEDMFVSVVRHATLSIKLCEFEIVLP